MSLDFKFSISIYLNWCKIKYVICIYANINIIKVKYIGDYHSLLMSFSYFAKASIEKLYVIAFEDQYGYGIFGTLNPGNSVGVFRPNQV